jgi:sec-independent protein translocase protein TatB
MLDLSWSHILILLIVALAVVPPKDLPRVMRQAGRWMGKARALADQFRRSFDEMARQSELDELRGELEALRHERPLADIDRTLRAPVLSPPAPIATANAPQSFPPKEQHEPAGGAAPQGPHE